MIFKMHENTRSDSTDHVWDTCEHRGHNMSTIGMDRKCAKNKKKNSPKAFQHCFPEEDVFWFVLNCLTFLLHWQMVDQMPDVYHNCLRVCLRRMQPPFYNICPVLNFLPFTLYYLLFALMSVSGICVCVCCRDLLSIFIQQPDTSGFL